MEYNKQLISEIKELISLKKEGVFWDYKEIHHKFSIDLIHDITCLSNAQYNGNRYIIFGVNDVGEIVGLKSCEMKEQANIIDTLRSSKYADDIFPDIQLENISLDEKEIQVLMIKDRPFKPYYLSVDKKVNEEQSRTTVLRAGTVYTRIMDTNTPKNSVASSKDIEYMWKERFGLIQTPIERMQMYLKNFEDWSFQNEIYFYKQHPEFTIKPLEDDWYKGAEENEWARGEIGYHYIGVNTTSVYGFFYHGTLMHTIARVIFDGGKKNIVNPDWEPIGKGRIYYFLEDSLKYTFQKFFLNESSEDYSKNLLSTNHTTFDIPVFSNKNELESFLFDIKKDFKLNSASSAERDEKKQNKLFNSYIEYYQKWRKK